MRSRLLCDAADLAPGTMRRIAFADRPAVLLYHVQARFYATSDRCTHGKVFLSRGTLDGFLVTCPAHFGSFDIRTGAATMLPCVAPIDVYTTEISEGKIYLLEPG